MRRPHSGDLVEIFIVILFFVLGTAIYYYFNVFVSKTVGSAQTKLNQKIQSGKHKAGQINAGRHIVLAPTELTGEELAAKLWESLPYESGPFRWVGDFRKEMAHSSETDSAVFIISYGEKIPGAFWRVLISSAGNEVTLETIEAREHEGFVVAVKHLDRLYGALLEEVRRIDPSVMVTETQQEIHWEKN